METLWQDLRYGLRMLAKNPGFTAVAILTLALGIGANTAIFTVVNAVLLRPLPYEHPDRLVMIFETVPQEGILDGAVSYPNFRDWRERNRVFEDIAVFRPADFTLTGMAEPERIPGASVSAGFFPLLRVRPVLGRAFGPEDDQAGAAGVVIVSHGFWQRRFGGDPGVVGKNVTLDQRTFTIIGVLPPGFRFPLAVISKADLWTPTAGDAGFFPQRGAHLWRAIARLKPDISPEQAQTEMKAIGRQIEAEHPDEMAGRGVHLVSLHQQVVGDVQGALLMLWGAVGLVLLIVCANVANLLLVRGAAREKELAVRLALGAGWRRLARQLMTESLLLAMVGGMLGVWLAWWVTEALVAMIPQDVPRMDQIGLDRRVFWFACGISLLTGLIFGLAPALSTSRIRLNESLKEGGRFTGRSGGRRLREALVTAEMGLAVVLLIGSGLMVRSVIKLLHIDAGIRPEQVLTFQMSVPFMQFDADPRANFYSDLEARLRVLPGVQSVGGSTSVPLSGRNHVGIGFEIVGRPSRPQDDRQTAAYDSVTPGYFRTMGIPLRAGRFLTEQDRRGRPGAIIINETMARRYWPNEHPLGQRIRLGASFGVEGEPESYQIVGVVGDVRDTSLDTAAEPHMYVSYRQQTWPFFTVALRTGGDPRSLIGAVRAAVAGLTANEAIYDFVTMEEYLATSVARRRFVMVLLGLFAGVALILSAVGLYGVVSYVAAQRTHEIGIRMALGAQSRDIVRLVVGQGAVLTSIGVGLGVTGAFAVTRLMTKLLFDVSPTDPLTFGVVALLLTGVALLACWVPARRATKVDPMVALRYE